MVDEKIVATIAKRIIEELNLSSMDNSKEEYGIFSNLDDAVEAASRAQKKLAVLDLEKREEIIQAIREACMNNARFLAELAVKETGRGRVEDKIVKNILAAKKTPGTEDLRP